MKKLLQILTVLIIVVGIIMLAFSYVATVVYADDGYPAPTEDIGYPVDWYGYPDPSYPSYYDVGYPVDYGYPVDIGYPMPIDYGYQVGYPVFEPIPDPAYPEPVASSPEIEPQSELEIIQPIFPQYRNNRNLWQEIVYQFGGLLALTK